MFDGRLRNIREKRGFSAKEVSKQLGIPYTTYLGYERDEREPSSSILVKLHKILNVSLDYLIGVSECESVDIAVQSISKVTGLSDELIDMILEENDAQVIKTFDVLAQQIFYSDLLSCLDEASTLINNIIKDEIALEQKVKNNEYFTQSYMENVKKNNDIRSQAAKLLESIGEYAISDFEYLDLLLFKTEQIFDDIIKLTTGYYEYDNNLNKDSLKSSKHPAPKNNQTLKEITALKRLDEDVVLVAENGEINRAERKTKKSDVSQADEIKALEKYFNNRSK